MKNLLLLSNSRMPGRGYLEHAVDAIRETLGGAKKVVLIPFASVTIVWDSTAKNVRLGLQALRDEGVEITAIHHFKDPVAALAECDAILVNGGNTSSARRTASSLEITAPVSVRPAFVGGLPVDPSPDVVLTTLAVPPSPPPPVPLIPTSLPPPLGDSPFPFVGGAALCVIQNTPAPSPAIATTATCCRMLVRLATVMKRPFAMLKITQSSTSATRMPPYWRSITRACALRALAPMLISVAWVISMFPLRRP